MAAPLKPYSTGYKDSGVEWLGEVPRHWGILPGRSCFCEKKEANHALQVKTVLSLSYGQIVVKPPEKLHGLVPSSFETYQIVDPLNIVIRPIDLQNDKNSLRIGLSKHRGIITSAYLCFLTSNRLVSEYGYLLLHSYDLMKIFYGMGSGLRQNLDWTDFKYLPCSVPPLPEQIAIARYLDYATGCIDRYIRAKEKLISLLAEQKQIIIHQAVTGQIDVRTGKPYPAYKDSGVKWLGKVPEHWEGLPLKRWVSTKITDGPHETPTFLASGIPFMSAESMVEGRLDFSRCRGFISRKQHNIYCRKCHPQLDDIFMCKSGATTGKVAIVKTANEFSIWSPLALIRVDSHKVLADLLFIVLQSSYIQRQVQDTWSYGTQPNLSMGAMERLFIVLPPVNEQQEIHVYLKQKLNELFKTTNRAYCQINLLREYRERLISDVVTGKLDVREAAARLPQEADKRASIEDSDEFTDREKYVDDHSSIDEISP